MRRAIGVVGVAAVAATVLPACSSVWTASSAPADSLAAASAREVFGDIERLQFAKRTQVQLPARLAVADVSSDSDDMRRKRLVESIDALSKDTTTWTDVSSLHLWSDDAQPRGQSWFEFLRSAASRQQADLLLVTQRREVERTEGNGLGLLNVLIVPIFLVPTRTVTTSVDVHAAAIDVRNGLIYATCDERGEREAAATLSGQDSTHREQADAIHAELAATLREQIGRKLSALERGQATGAFSPAVR